MSKEFKKLDVKFKGLVSTEKLNINALEDLMLDNMEEHRIKLNNHIEELILDEIDEKKIIAKKNKNGKKRDLN